MRRTFARPRRFGVVVAITGLAALSACTDTAEGNGIASDGTADTAPLDDDDQALAFAGGMRDNGVDMPDPGPGQQGLAEAFQAVTGDYDNATLQQAIAACQDLMPQYASEEQHEEGWELELAECRREQGLDVSDDPFEDAHRGEVDVNEFSAAMEVCRHVLTGEGQ